MSSEDRTIVRESLSVNKNGKTNETEEMHHRGDAQQSCMEEENRNTESLSDDIFQ